MAETVRYSQCGLQDIRIGRNQFEVTLASGQTVLFDEVDFGYVLANLTGLKTYATVAALPAVDSSFPGRLARVTADGKLYVDNGTAWIAFAIPGGTTGSIPFYSATGLAQDNSNLFWDDTNNRLGVGAATNLNERINIANNSYLAGVNAAGNATKKLIGFNASDRVIVGESGTDVHVNGPLTANQNVTVATGKTLTLTDATANGILYAPSGGVVTSLAALTNGQTFIGKTGNAPTVGTITGTGNISVTNGPGTITIESTGADLYHHATSTTTLVSSVVETSVYSFTLGAQDLDPTNHTLMVVVGGTYLNDSGANKTLTLKVTIGGVTMYEDTTAVIPNSANTRTWMLTFFLSATTVAAEFFTGKFSLSAVTAPTTGNGSLGTNDTINSTIYNLTARTLTIDNLIDVLFTHSASAATVSLSRTVGFAILL